ncbi:MAG: tetratricopeptide repeat protein [Acidobacteria bacterium]|nr:tetratricopeptide repeat protein [Acidobacteriota bacterium]
MTKLKQKLLLMGFGLLVPLVLLLLMEGVLALAGMGGDEGGEDPYVGFVPGSRLFEEKVVAGERRYVTRPAKLAFFNEQSFPVEKEEETFRIFTLGGSTTAGRPYDDRASFSNWLRLYLAEADPSRRWEVINAGAVSYASYRVTLLMQELVRYQPDLFIVYTGHNEFLEERSYTEILRQPESLRRLRQWLSSFRLARVFRKAVQKGKPEADPEKEVTLAPEVQARLDGWTGLDAYERDDELARGVEEHFAFNLRRMVELARKAGAQIVFVKPASNLKDFSPFKSQPGASVRPEDVGRARALREQSSAWLRRGEPEAAEAAAQEAVNLDPLFADASFLLGRSRFELGDLGSAREALVQAKELDVAPLRALESLVADVGEVGAEERVPVFDFPRFLALVSRQKWGHDVFGSELFQDHVHPTMEVHAWIARELLGLMAKEGWVNPRPSWNTTAAERIFERETAGFDRVYYAQRDMNLGKVLGWTGKLREAEEPLRRAAEVLTDNPDLFLNLGILLSKTGRPAEAVPVLEKARRLDPSSALAAFNLGVAYGKLGELDQGIAALRSAVSKRPDLAEAHFDLGSLLEGQGDLDGSERELRRALELKPGAWEVVEALASLLAKKGDPAAAEDLLRKSLEAQPRAGGHVALARVLARADRLEEALEEAKKASALDPASAEAYYSEGLVLNRLGEEQAAEEAYAEALAVDPGHSRSANNLALRKAASGDLQGASELLLQAIDSDPAYADAYFNLGVVYDQAGEPAEAARAITKALELDPENARYREALEMLRQAQGVRLQRSLS